MLAKGKNDQTNFRCPQGTLKFLARMTKKGPYERMDKDGKELKKKSKKSEEKKPEEFTKGNNQAMYNKEGKEKKKRKGWKRVRHVALVTCRYIGMGAAHMSPATLYTSPHYCTDPQRWNRSFSSSYKPKVQQQTPHWTSSMMFSGW